MNGRHIRISAEIYDDIEKIRSRLINKAGLHKNLSIKETMDILWNVKENKGITIEQAISHIKSSDINISWGRNARGKTKRHRRGQLNVRVNGKKVQRFNLLHNKRGSAFDVMFLVFVVIIMGISAFVLTDVWENLYQPNKPGSVFNQTAETAKIGANTNDTIRLLDFIVPTVLFFGIVIIGVLVYTNPIPAPFLIFGLLFSALLVYFAIIFREAYIDMLANSATFTSYVVHFPITDLILRNLSMYVLFLYALVLVVTYSRGGANA